MVCCHCFGRWWCGVGHFCTILGCYLLYKAGKRTEDYLETWSPAGVGPIKPLFNTLYTACAVMSVIAAVGSLGIFYDLVTPTTVAAIANAVCMGIEIWFYVKILQSGRKLAETFGTVFDLALYSADRVTLPRTVHLANKIQKMFKCCGGLDRKVWYDLYQYELTPWQVPSSCGEREWVYYRPDSYDYYFAPVGIGYDRPCSEALANWPNDNIGVFTAGLVILLMFHALLILGECCFIEGKYVEEMKSKIGEYVRRSTLRREREMLDIERCEVGAVLAPSPLRQPIAKNVYEHDLGIFPQPLPWWLKPNPMYERYVDTHTSNHRPRTSPPPRARSAPG